VVLHAGLKFKNKNKNKKQRDYTHRLVVCLETKTKTVRSIKKRNLVVHLSHLFVLEDQTVRRPFKTQRKNEILEIF
jgi:hypothetical protein